MSSLVVSTVQAQETAVPAVLLVAYLRVSFKALAETSGIYLFWKVRNCFSILFSSSRALCFRPPSQVLAPRLKRINLITYALLQ